MIKKVRKSERPTITWLGGICCRDNALLTKSSTITTLVKAVIIITIEGARVSIESRKRIWRLRATSFAPVASLILKAILGIGIFTPPTFCAKSAAGSSNTTAVRM
jgi:hypothetical protein